MRTRLLFLAVVTPLAVIGRPLWRRRLGLDFAPRARTYWRVRGDSVSSHDLRTRP